MGNVMRNTVLAALTLSMVMAADQDIPTLIAALSDSNNATRAEAAALLREKLAENPSLRLDDHGEEFWTKRFSSIQPGMKEALVLKLLPANARKELIAGTGGGHVEVWRLDSYWKLDVAYHNPDTVAAQPKLTHEAMPLWVQPPTDHTGPWVSYYVNGQKLSESQYRNGKYEGTVSGYHDNGQKSYEQHYAEGVSNGPDFGWYRDGRRMYEGQYANDKQAGKWTRWREDGKLMQREEYKDGQLDGISTFWHPNGQMQREVHYKNGKEDGLVRVWDASGKLLWSVEYTDGKQSAW